MNHHHNVRTLMALMILCIGFLILLVFQMNSENIIESNNFKLFMTLAVIGCGLLIGLLYLVSNSKPHTPSKPAKVTKKSKTKKKK